MSRLAQTLCTAGCVLGLVASTAHADRRTALSGNLLIEDQDDVFLFPNRLNDYGNMITFDYGLSSASGNGLFTMSDGSQGFGVALRRGTVLSPHGSVGNALNAGGLQLAALNDPPSLFPSAEFGQGFDTAPPATMLDVLYGSSSGDSGWGLRLSLGRGASVQTDAMGDQTGEEQLYLMGEFGYGRGTRGQDTSWDMSVSALLDVANAVNAGTDTLSGTGFGLDGLVRLYFPMYTDVDFGVLGNIGIGTRSVTDQLSMPEASASELAFGVAGGAGPAMRFGDAEVAAYGTVRFGLEAFDPDSETEDDGSGTVTFVVPGLLASVEVAVLDWLYVRTGAQYDFALVGQGAEANDAGTSSASGSFGWNAGLGILIDSFRFDGTLQDGFVTNGPNFIGGGAGPGFLAIASMTYVFDKTRDGMHRPIEAGEDVEEPEVAPEPEPEPEPMLPPAPAPVPAEPAPPGPAEVPDGSESGEAGVQGDAQAGDGKVEASGGARIGTAVSTP